MPDKLVVAVICARLPPTLLALAFLASMNSFILLFCLYQYAPIESDTTEQN